MNPRQGTAQSLHRLYEPLQRPAFGRHLRSRPQADDGTPWRKLRRLPARTDIGPLTLPDRHFQHCLAFLRDDKARVSHDGEQAINFRGQDSQTAFTRTETSRVFLGLHTEALLDPADGLKEEPIAAYLPLESRNRSQIKQGIHLELTNPHRHLQIAEQV